MQPFEKINDWLDWTLVPSEEIVIESEFECEFLQKCEKIELNKDEIDKQFLKDLTKIRQGYYNISVKCRQSLLELGYEI